MTRFRPLLELLAVAAALTFVAVDLADARPRSSIGSRGKRASPRSQIVAASSGRPALKAAAARRTSSSALSVMAALEQSGSGAAIQSACASLDCKIAVALRTIGYSAGSAASSVG